MEKSVFLTGGTGFVGSHTAAEFLRHGWKVRALVRRPNDPGSLPGVTERIPGDLLEPQSYAPAMRGCAAVVHAAGVTKARSLAEYRRVNADGAAAVASAAAAACPEAMFVLVSSQSAGGPSGGRPVTEADPPHPVSWYGLSKLEGEESVAKLRRGPWCAVRPCVVYGPGDRGLLQLFATIARGWAPVLAGGNRRIQLIAAGDLARVIVAASTRPDLAGRRGFAAADTVRMGELTAEIASLRRPPARKIPVPSVAVVLAGLLESARERLTRRPRPFNRDKAREILAPEWVCDAGPFLSDLRVDGLKPWKEGIRETCRWYVREGWLPSCFGEL